MTGSITNAAEWILSGGDAGAAALYSGDGGRHLWRASRAGGRPGPPGLPDAGLARGDRVGTARRERPAASSPPTWRRAGRAVRRAAADRARARRRWQRMVAGAEASRIVVSARLLPRPQPTAARLGVGLLAESPDAACRAAAARRRSIPRRDLAAIMWTSGSTGEPKGVMVTHANILCNTRDIIDYMGLRPQDRVMAVLPFSYCYGISLLHTHLAVGGSLVLNNRFMFPEKVLDDLAREAVHRPGRRARHLPNPAPQDALRPAEVSRAALAATSGREAARPVSPRVAPGAAAGASSMSCTARPRRPRGSAISRPSGSTRSWARSARGLPHARLEVLAADGTPVRPGSGEVGEIVASGENVTPGYWNDPEETARYFRDGKLYTGDMARVDARRIPLPRRARPRFHQGHGQSRQPEGSGRSAGRIAAGRRGGRDRRGRRNLGRGGQGVPRHDHAGMPDRRRRCAAIVLQRLPNYKVPQYVEFLPRLPKTSHGKIDKQRLRRRRGDTMNAAALDRKIEQLIRGPQYALPQAEKDAALDGDPARALPGRGRRAARPTAASSTAAARRPRDWRRAGRHPAAAGGDVQTVPALGGPAGADRARAALLGHQRPAAQPDRRRQDDGLSAGPGAGRRSSRSTWAAGGGRSWCSTRRSRPAAGEKPVRPGRRHPRHRQLRLGNRLRHEALARRANWSRTGTRSRRSSPGIATMRCCCSVSPTSSGRGFLLGSRAAGAAFPGPAGGAAALRRLEEADRRRP